MSLNLLLEMAAGGHGDRIALGSGPDATTFARLAELAAGGGAVLADRGAGQAVLLARNGPILPHLLFAASHAGLPLVPMNYRLSAEMIQELLERLDSPFVVADEDYLPVVADRVPGMTVSEFLAGAAAAAPADAPFVADSAPAVLLFTSGTTAKPKVVPLRPLPSLLRRRGHLSSSLGQITHFSSFDLLNVGQVLGNALLGSDPSRPLGSMRASVWSSVEDQFQVARHSRSPGSQNREFRVWSICL